MVLHFEFESKLATREVRARSPAEQIRWGANGAVFGKLAIFKHFQMGKKKFKISS